MRKALVLLIPVLVSMLASCASSTPAFITGAWSASLANSDGSSAFGFAATFRQKSGSSVTVSNFGFTPPQSCFGGQTNATSTFASTGIMNGVQTGNFRMTISPASPGAQGIIQNTLTLQGNAQSNSTISGTWTLGGTPGCNGNGTFVMTPHPPV